MAQAEASVKSLDETNEYATRAIGSNPEAYGYQGIPYHIAYLDQWESN